MDPITAFGVATNVLQFLDFGQRLYATSVEIYSAANGTSSKVSDSKILLQDFVASLDTISLDLQRYSSTLHTTSDLSFNQTLVSLSTCGTYSGHDSAKGDSSIRDVVRGCRQLSKELLDRFEGLRIGGKHRRWKSTIASLKCLWQEKELENLKDRLNEYRSQLEWDILVSLRSVYPVIVDWCFIPLS